MLNPKLYAKNNALPRRDADDVIATYIHLIHWNPSGGDKILDIGSGTGETLWDHLKPVLPENYGTLLGSDISDAMVIHAATKYVHPKINFFKLDISLTPIPEYLRQRFDHAFSFYCLHFLSDQRQAFQNIYDLLKPGGDMLVAYLASHPSFDLNIKMANMPKWKSYMLDVQELIAPYQHVKNVVEILEERLESVGFQVKVCKCKDMAYEYENFNAYFSAMVSVSPFIDRLPKNLRNQYILDLKDKHYQTLLSEGNYNDKSERVVRRYRMIVICASKPQ